MDDLLSVNDAPTQSQIRHFVNLVRALDTAEEGIDRVWFAELREYRLLTSGAEACGFVCHDIDLGDASDVWNDLASNTDKMSEASLSQIRHLVHFLIRTERRINSGGENGGGWIHGATQSGLFKAIVDRLSALDCKV